MLGHNKEGSRLTKSGALFTLIGHKPAVGVSFDMSVGFPDEVGLTVFIFVDGLCGLSIIEII